MTSAASLLKTAPSNLNCGMLQAWRAIAQGRKKSFPQSASSTYWAMKMGDQNETGRLIVAVKNFERRLFPVAFLFPGTFVASRTISGLMVVGRKRERRVKLSQNKCPKGRSTHHRTARSLKNVLHLGENVFQTPKKVSSPHPHRA